MKYLKTYEDSNEINLFKKEDLDNSYWYAAGDFDTIIILFNKFLKGKKTHNFIKYFKAQKTSFAMVGCYLAKNENHYYYFTIIEDGNVKLNHNVSKKYLYDIGCEYRGEIKLDSKGDVYVDTFELDVNKYNL